MNSKDILIAARRLIEGPENWTQGRYALDASGEETSWADPNACRFCVDGALMHASPEERDDAIYIAATRALEMVVGRGITTWNDAPERKHPEVLAAFDKAIELAPVCSE